MVPHDSTSDLPLDDVMSESLISTYFPLAPNVARVAEKWACVCKIHAVAGPATCISYVGTYLLLILDYSLSHMFVSGSASLAFFSKSQK